MSEIKRFIMNSQIYFKIISFGGFLFLLLALPIIYTVYSQNNKIGKRVKPLIVIKDANRPSLSYDGRRVVEGPEIGLSEVFDVDTGKKLRTFGVKGSESEAISSDGSRVVIFSSEITSITEKGYNSKGIYSIYDVNSGELIRQDDAKIVQDGVVKERYSVVFNEGGFNSKNISSDLNLIARRYTFQPSDKSTTRPAVIIGKLEDYSLWRELKTDDGFVSGDIWGHVSITPDGKFVAAYRHNSKDSQRNKTVVWEAETGKVILDLPFYDLESLSDDGKRIATEKSNDEGQIEIWDVPNRKRISTLTEMVKGKKIIISRGIISPDGKMLVTTGNEEFYFWDTETGKFITSQRLDDYSRGVVKSATFSGDGKRIAVGSDTEVVTVWSVDEILKNLNETIAEE